MPKYDIPAYRHGNFNPVAGRYLTPIGLPATAAATQSLLTASPIWLPRRTHFDRIAVNVTTGAASTDIRVGVYKDNGRGEPGALVLDAGLLDSDSTAAVEATIDLWLPRGLYWLAAVAQGGTPSTRVVGQPVSDFVNVAASSIAGATAGARAGYSRAAVTGALPDPFQGTLSFGTNSIFVALRIAA